MWMQKSDEMKFCTTCVQKAKIQWKTWRKCTGFLFVQSVVTLVGYHGSIRFSAYVESMAESSTMRKSHIFQNDTMI